MAKKSEGDPKGKARPRVRRAASAPAAQSEALLRLESLLLASPSVIYSAKPEGNWPTTFISSNVKPLFGYEPQAFLEDPSFWMAHIHPDDRGRVVSELAASLQLIHQYRFRHADGTYRWVQDDMRLVRDATGRPIECVGSLTDITVLKQMEDDAARNAERLGMIHAIINRSRVVMFLWRADPYVWPVELVSENVEGLTGYTPGDFMSGRVSWPGIVCQDDVPRLEAEVAVFLQKGIDDWSQEYRIVAKSGETRWIRDWNRVIRDKSGEITHIQALLADITSSHKAAEALSASEERYRTLAESSPDMIFIVDHELRLVFVNRRAANWVGSQPEQMLGLDLSALFAPGHAEEAQDRLKQVIRTGEPFSIEENLQLGSRTARLDMRFMPLKDESGLVTAGMGLLRDVTDRHELEQQHLRAQRLESLGALAGGIAHDLNNMLYPVIMGIDVLKDCISDRSSRDLLDTMAESARRGAEMVRQVLAFGRGVTDERFPLQIKQVVREVTGIVRQTFPKDIQVLMHLPEELPLVVAEMTQLQQVLMNLCVNARDAMPDGGVLSIRAESVALDEAFTRKIAGAQPGAYVLLTVKDTGTGIAPDVLDKIFDPFFTTKEFGKGTGLGLSTVQGIVKGHGGFVTVQTEMGKGTSFCVYLPISPVNEGANPSVVEEESPQGNGETVLVVDDEVGLLEITKVTLESNGYRAFIVTSGAEAVALYAEHKDRIQVVIVDMMMPVMNGRATIQALRALSPDVRVLAISGVASMGATLDRKHLRFLAKPFGKRDLLVMLRKVLTNA